ncbi:hypothetical protein HJ590_10770 [Naumannella sp. ID2617S]|nr:hypothetical protein [Naumannella sp. ID2617S]
MNKPPSSTSDRTLWWGFGVLAVMLVASLIGFAWLPQAPVASADSRAGNPGVSGPGGSATPRRTPTPSPTPEPPKVTDPADAPMYRMELTLSACPSFTPRKGVVPRAELRPYLESIMTCLVASHQDSLQRAGLPTVAPKLAEDDKVGDSPCSGPEEPPTGWAALYCSGDNTIYYHPEWKPQHGPYVGVMAHEYAHHLQWLTGILDEVHEREAKAKTEPNGQIKANEVSRRTELQAQCIAGAVLNGGWSPLRSREVYDEFIEGTSTMNPEGAATHGTGRANNRWIAAGGTSAGPTHYKACNTFTAPADQVD